MTLSPMSILDRKGTNVVRIKSLTSAAVLSRFELPQRGQRTVAHSRFPVIRNVVGSSALSESMKLGHSPGSTMP